MKKVADKLASFVAKNGRQFEDITRQKNPGDTPFKYVLCKPIFLCIIFLCKAHIMLSVCFKFNLETFMFYLYVVFVLFADFYLMRPVQTTNTMSIGSLKRKKLFYRARILKSPPLVSTLIAMLVFDYSLNFFIWAMETEEMHFFP